LQPSCLAWLHLAATSSHVGANGDRPTYPLHHPITYGWQTRVHSPFTDVVLLYLPSNLLLRVPLPMPAHTLWLSGKGTEPLIGAAQSSHSAWGGAGFGSAVLEGERPLGRASCFGVEGSSPKWTELVNGDGESERGNL
jgi:hypothetical protein